MRANLFFRRDVMKTFKKVALVACMAMCAGALFAEGVKVEAGSGNDPFTGTAWVADGNDVLAFKDGGKVEYNGNEYAYTVEQDGEKYTVRFEAADVKGEITVAASRRGIFLQGGFPYHTEKRIVCRADFLTVRKADFRQRQESSK